MSENRNTINWYPGHMEKAKRQMLERLKAVDMVIEVRDARIPDASTNPMLLSMVQNKPRVIILSKCDMADPVVTQQWIEKLNSESVLAIALDLMHDPKSGKKLAQACLKIMQPKREKQIAERERKLEHLLIRNEADTLYDCITEIADKLTDDQIRVLGKDFFIDRINKLSNYHY